MTEAKKEEMRQKLGNITQIRDLLFGSEIEEYERKFTASKIEIQNIESNIENLNLNLERFKSDIKEHLSQLKSTMSEEINSAVDSLEKKLKYLGANTYGEIKNIRQEIEVKTNNNSQKIELAVDRFDLELKSLKEEADRNQESLNKNLNRLKKQLSETIENNLADLSEAKVSRSDLAEVLFELCLKVKEQDNNPGLAEYNSNSDFNGRTNSNDEELILLKENTPQ